jgi:hypothetical protein
MKMILVASCLSLLVIAAGIFLYSKTIKDELSRFIRIAAYFLIIVGFMNFFAAGALFMAKGIHSCFDKGDGMRNTCMKHHGKKNKKCKSQTRSCYMLQDGMCGKSMDCDPHHEMMMKMHGGSSCMMEHKIPCMMGAKMPCVKEGGPMKKDSIMLKK